MERYADELAGVVEQAMRQHGVPGLALGLLHRGEEHIAGFGVTNAHHPLAVTGATIFQAASITKTLTATAIMRLVERGSLALETPIRAYLPELRLADEEVAKNITLAHLLTHAAGWAEFSDGKMVPPDTGPGHDALERVVPLLAELRQEHPLGAQWAYTNHGYALAGRVIEVVTGQTYERAIVDLVLAPLGMRQSTFFAREAIIHAVAAGHWWRPAGPEIARPWGLARSANPAGGLLTTVSDLLRYARFHLGDGTAPDGTRLLSMESLVAMRAPRQAAGWMADSVGLSWHLRHTGGAVLAGHDGLANGQQSALMLEPQSDFAIAVLTNSNRGFEAIYEIVTWVLDRYLGLPRPPAFDPYLATVRQFS